MPLQNRVDPYGELHAVAARGAWLGNRGVLHDECKRVRRRWQVKRWITCVVEFRGRQREVFAAHRYSELFFLDEATSFAAGHRPCAECRRARFNEFRDAWLAAHVRGVERERVRVDAIDDVLHTERVRRGGAKVTYRTHVATLPDGTLIEHDGVPHLLWRGAAHRWSFDGYTRSPAMPPTASQVAVLTPPSIVRLFADGFVPQVHPTAEDGDDPHSRQSIDDPHRFP